MDEPDPEQRIADLEHQPAEVKRKVEQANAPQQGLTSDALDETMPGVAAMPRLETTPRWFYPVFTTFMLLGGAMGGSGILIGVAPSSTQWMSGIVCSSPHQLSHKTFGGEVDYQCVSGLSSYTPNALTMFGLQSLLVLAVLSIGFVGWRLLRNVRRRPPTGADPRGMSRLQS